MPGDMKAATVHVTEEEQIHYSVALSKESMKRQREELAWTKNECPCQQKRYKELEKGIRQMEKLIQYARG